MDIAVDGRNYQIGKLDALKQFHIARKLAPALASIGVTVAELEKVGQGMVGGAAESFLAALGPVSEVLAKMSEEDTNYVLFTCLGVVSMDQGEGRFAPISRNNLLMFEDIDMLLMLKLTGEVVKFNLEGFFQGLGGTKS
jgi:hypothetical protein